MLDTILGLPAHPLLVHLPVVLLPLAALGLLVLVLKPSLRPAYALPLLGLLALGALGAIGSYLSGEYLSDLVGFPERHAALGTATMATGAALLVLGGAWLVWTRRSTEPHLAQQVAGWVVAALAVAVTVLTVLTGHSGATAAWSGAAQPAVGSTPGQPTEQTTAEVTGYTMADVQTHDSASDCWAAIGGNVYDLTAWISEHPGGPQRIENLCGTDATSAFTAQHSGNEKPQERLSGFLLGPLR